MQLHRTAPLLSSLWLGCGSVGPSPTDSAATPDPMTVQEAIALGSTPDVGTPESPPVLPARSEIPARATTLAESVSPQLRTFVGRQGQDGALWAGPLEGNGGRDVVVYVPPGADPAAGVQVVYHFHGTYSENMADPADGGPKKAWVGWDRLVQTMDAIEDVQRQSPFNVALVYPISAGKRLEPGHRGWSNVMYDRMWMLKAPEPGYRDDFDTLHEEVHERLTKDFGVAPSLVLPRVWIEGHSAGGIALRNVAQSVQRVEVEEYIFLDASFQGWADGCHAAIRAANAGSRITLVLTDRGIADPFGKRDPWCETTPRIVSRLPEHRAFCAARPTDKPPRETMTCRELAELAEVWERSQQWWCEQLASDMADVPDVHVHRTRIPHGKQPRHFSGGLELPADRFSEGSAKVLEDGP